MVHERYPLTYQPETSPAWLHHAAVVCGRHAASPRSQFRYLELGSGGGFSSLVHAAGYPDAVFHAVDRDARAIAHARATARALGLSNLAFVAMTFDDARLDNLPPFDFIVLHGVYSWVDANTRARLRALSRELLAPGGLLYVSYNCEPGWAAEMPLRRLLVEIVERSRAEDPLATAVGSIDALRAAGAPYFSAYPAVARRIASFSGQPAGYLAHEYLSDAWDPLWSVDVRGDFAHAGLTFVASATLADNDDALVVGAELSCALAEMPSARSRAIALDFALNRGFKRDLFQRSDAKEGEAAPPDALVIGWAGETEKMPETMLVPRGRVRFQPDFIRATGRLLEQGAMSIQDLAARIAPDRRGETVRNLIWLTAGGVLQPFAREGRTGPLPARTALPMLRGIARGTFPGWIASPAIGGGARIDACTASLALSAREGHQSACTKERSAVERLRRLGVI